MMSEARGALFSAVDLTEVLAKVDDRGMPVADVRRLIDRLELEIVPFDKHQAEVAAKFRAPTRGKDVSLADRACIGLTSDRGGHVLTADTQWSELDLGIDIRQIR